MSNLFLKGHGTMQGRFNINKQSQVNVISGFEKGVFKECFCSRSKIMQEKTLAKMNITYYTFFSIMKESFILKLGSYQDDEGFHRFQ